MSSTLKRIEIRTCIACVAPRHPFLPEVPCRSPLTPCPGTLSLGKSQPRSTSHGGREGKNVGLCEGFLQAYGVRFRNKGTKALVAEVAFMCIALSVGRDKKVTCSTALGDIFPGSALAEARPAVHYLHTAGQKSCKQT